MLSVLAVCGAAYFAGMVAAVQIYLPFCRACSDLCDSASEPLRTAGQAGVETKRYPIPASVIRCLGIEPFCSIFFLKLAICTLT